MLIKKINILLFVLTFSYITKGHIVPITYHYKQKVVEKKAFNDGNHVDLLNEVLLPKSYYVDAINGNDNNDGSINAPWHSLGKVSATTFAPGDNIFFKRGTAYNGSVTIQGDGTAALPITIGAYGSGDAPKFTNPNYTLNAGNAMRIRGDYHIVENLHFHHTAPAPTNASSFEEVWEVGALHISKGNDHVVVRKNEFSNIPKAIQSYSENSLITENYIHDANINQENGFLQNPYWGPIGIQLGIGNQEVSYNRIENMYAVGGAFVADGGAIEIDDGRNHKNNIHIHHNRTLHNMGFMEVSYWDDIAFMPSNNVTVAYNLSRDYQSFLLWWAPTNNSLVKNNTIIRDDNEIMGNWNAVYILDAPPGNINITKNIVVVDNDQTESIFIQGFDGAVNDVVHADNCYWNADGGNIDLGLSQGSGEIFVNPQFVDYSQSNYYLLTGSPAIGWGAFSSNNCETDLTINDNLITTNTYQASNTITVSGIINDASNVSLKAGQSIKLQTGFHAQAGSEFLATIESCENLSEKSDAISDNIRSANQSPKTNQMFSASNGNGLQLNTYPNPFKQSTRIAYYLPEKDKITLKVVNQFGQEIATLSDKEVQNKGSYTVDFSLLENQIGTFYIIIQGKQSYKAAKMIRVR